MKIAKSEYFVGQMRDNRNNIFYVCSSNPGEQTSNYSKYLYNGQSKHVLQWKRNNTRGIRRLHFLNFDQDKLRKSTGLDNFPARCIKYGAQNITKPYTHIVNLSISTAQVPKDLKEARIIPLFKQGKRTEAINYMPVSILCILSKVLERRVYDQMES